MTGAHEHNERLPEALVDELKRIDRASGRAGAGGGALRNNRGC